MASFLLGPIYAPPSGLAHSPTVDALSTHVSSTLLHALQEGHGSVGDFTANSSSVSVTAMSIEDSDSSPFFNFHFSAPNLNETAGTKIVTESSIYRIGSISKLFTVYMLLLSLGRGYWDDSVTRYVPELRHPAESFQHGQAVDHVDWEHVSVSSLASQLSGIGRDYANGDLASQGLLWKAAGFPQLPSEDVPVCAGNDSLPPCNRQEYFQGFPKRHPVFSPYTTPVYSNAAFRILGYVLEAASGLSFTKVLKSSVLEPLRLATTSAKRPQSGGSWVIPQGDSGWFQDVGDETPTAGMYSSSHDLAKFGRAILAHQLLPAIETRRWMKPHSHTSNLVLSVGNPWEIWRTKSRITSGRTVDLYTKSGSLGVYNSHLVLIPDYGVSISVLAAGPSSSLAVDTVAEITLQALIPVLETISREQACAAVCGTYRASSVGHNSSIAISTDAEGLVITHWISRGLDFRAMAQEYAEQTGGGTISAFRLQKTNLESTPNQEGVRRVSYRVIFDTNPVASHFPRPLSKKSPLIFDPSVRTWSSMDSLMYGEIAVDDLVFRSDRGGRVTAVESRALREILHRE